jgi:hypothetical protein
VGAGEDRGGAQRVEDPRGAEAAAVLVVAGAQGGEGSEEGRLAALVEDRGAEDEREEDRRSQTARGELVVDLGGERE